MVNNVIVQSIIGNNKEKPKQYFASRWAKGRIFSHKVKVLGNMTNNVPSHHFQGDERNSSLLARKLHKRSEMGNKAHFWANNGRIAFLYVATKGYGVNKTWNLKRVLEKIADFG